FSPSVSTPSTCRWLKWGWAAGYSTNVFQATDVCVITPLSLEHTPILGDTVEAIATEKAGITRPGSRVVMAVQAYPEAAEVVRAAAARAGASLQEVEQAY